MQVTFNYSDWSFWEAYDPGAGNFGPQKVTFDGPERIIYVNSGERELNVLNDIYSAWKEWSLIHDNTKYPQALTAVGGDPITTTQAVGVTYFLENGWRIQPASENHILDVSGNLYTREPGGDPYLDPLGNFRVTISSTRSNLVDQISAGPSGPNLCPTVDEIADAVRVELTPELVQIDNIDTTVQIIDTKLDLLDALLVSVDTKIDAVIDGVALIQIDTTAMLTILELLRKFETNRTRIDPTQKTLTIYDDDNTTPYAVFVLKDENNTESVECVFERLPI